ncbi:MAG: N-acetylmuramoyl-L-alanine amidase [Myxococcales bacterium]|jgi:MYXO-CTERM domain-containing protein|nr:N-acetylmuramoyl-L-alanine amidase [Myxococcales bacterium]
MKRCLFLAASIAFVFAAVGTEALARSVDHDAELRRAEAGIGALDIAPAPLTRASSEVPYIRPFPADMRVGAIERTASGAILIHLEGDFGPAPRHAKDRAGAGLLDELRLESIRGALLAAEVESPYEIVVRDPSGTYRPLGDIATPEERAAFREERSRARSKAMASRAANPARAERFPDGAALMGKRIAISAGHGWVKDPTHASWSFQRGVCRLSGSYRGIHEDLSNSDFVSHWLVPILQNMGAEVVLAREPDHSEGVSLIDDGKTGYSESGAWANGSNAGGWESDYRYASTGNDTATFSTTFSTSGWRRFSTWYLEGSNRTTQARHTIQHGGGTTPIDVDQTQKGVHFVDLGSYWCAAGVPCSVTLSNDAGSGVLIGDAVKIGGGTFTYSGSSSKPLWQISAYNYLSDFLGKSTSSLVNDVQSRPRFAEMIGADAFISIHSNAAGSSACVASGGGGATAHGISTYRYNCGTDSTSCDDPAGSKRLSNLVHPSALARVRADWDPNFCDRKENVANLGEVRELTSIPGVLVEMAFHDNLKTPQACTGSGTPKMTDNEAMHDPRWREAMANGIAAGIAKYFGALGAPPARPTGLKAINGASPCALTVSWNAVPGATGYRLYVIDNLRPGYERAFDKGRVVRGTSMTLTDLTPGKVYVFRVAAFDANGEGFPSSAVTARVLAWGERVEGLYVNGYDRRDAFVQAQDNDLAYAAEHGIALAAVEGGGFYFDGVLRDVAESSTFNLSNYAVIDYQAGKNSTEHHSVTAQMQTRLTSYLASGGKLFISGEEIAWDLGSKSNGKSFLENQLEATYVADDANVLKMSGSGVGPFAGLSAITFDDGTHGTYEVIYPDAIGATTGSTAVMTYDGTSYTAAVASDSVIYFGLPLETVYPALSRAKLFACGIGRLLNGPSWTCNHAAIALASTGAVEGLCDDPTVPPDPPDAGTSDAGDEPDPNDDAGWQPDAGSDPNNPDSGNPSGDADDPGDPNTHLPDASNGGPNYGVLEGSSGCSSATSSTAPPMAAFLFLMVLTALARRRLG